MWREPGPDIGRAAQDHDWLCSYATLGAIADPEIGLRSSVVRKKPWSASRR